MVWELVLSLSLEGFQPPWYNALRPGLTPWLSQAEELELRPPEVPAGLKYLVLIQCSQFAEDIRMLERTPGRPD